MPSEAADKKYRAFISYSSKDRKWGQWLHRRLENYPIPKEFQGNRIFDGSVLGKNLRPVFRDRDELSGGSNLGSAILEALGQSRFLIVLCSPNSARSHWVDQEIKSFVGMHGEKNLLALIIDGEPNASSAGDAAGAMNECFPPSLRYPVEPLAGDLRKCGDGKERGFLKIVSGMTGLDFDVLYRRHERALRRRVIAWGAMAAIIISALAGLSAFSIKKSREQQVLLDNIALADHDSALQASEQGRYRESAAYYARSLAIRPGNNTIALSAVGSAIFADTLFAKQRHIVKTADAITGLSLEPAKDLLHITTRGEPVTLSLVDGRKTDASPGAGWIAITQPDMAKMAADFPWLSGAVPGLSVAVVSPDGTKVFAGSSSGKLHKLDIATHNDEWAGLAKQRKNLIPCIAVSPCGQTLAVADWDSTLSLIDAGTGALQDSIQFAYNVERLFFSTSGYFMVATSQDGYVRVFDTGASLLLWKTARTEVDALPFPEDDYGMVFHLTGGNTLVETISGKEKTLKEKLSLPQPAGLFRVSPDRKFFVTGNKKGYLMTVSLADEKVHTTRRNGRITDISISPDSRTCYASSRDRNLIAYDLETGAEKWKQAFKGYVNSVSLSRDGKFIAAASDDFTFRVFDAASGKCVWYSLTDNCVEMIAFDKERLRVATKDDFIGLDCRHLFRSIPDERGELASFLVTHAAMRVHELSPIRPARRSDRTDNIRTILDWKNEHPARKTSSPFSNEIISEGASEVLAKGSVAQARQFHRLAPWHPLTPASIARLPENAGNTAHQRYLCNLTVNRFLTVDPDAWDGKQLSQDREVASGWMEELGFADLAAKLAPGK